ncbi:hypothetical protein [Microbulbifer hydrolyticus]|uniref:Uncharacterized protein n=1 Tax=Microbulbifer hydrolyticus TaxID=48074 RepID=A0A6P1TCE2_9GAMM|nr:hypothetical protein [Microbulbifer hydrolyticus]MBB5211973.1 hypothetical protein [Microbulbifer hydrolyticus]QHQ39657.1 hypothetical protein GTQ55_12110 [Microbulbifer hydrolyticus]
MSKIYAIRNDGFGYQSLDLTLLDIARYAPEDIDPDAVMDFSRTNSRLAEWWQTPDTRFVCNEGVNDKGIPDISAWIGASLVLSPKAHRYLSDTLKSYGELLPVTVGNDTFFIFNCTQLGEEDLSMSEYETQGEIPIQLLNLAFRNSAQTLPVFKSRYESCLTVFCNERFMHAVEDFNLTGVVFDENLVPQY